jgi:hypothetical protein
MVFSKQKPDRQGGLFMFSKQKPDRQEGLPFSEGLSFSK